MVVSLRDELLIWIWFDKKVNSTYVLLDTELESSILHHEDAVVIVSRPEQTFAFLQLDKHHVATQLQEQGLLKMSQDPTASCRKKRGYEKPTEEAKSVGKVLLLYLTFFSM